MLLKIASRVSCSLKPSNSGITLCAVPLRSCSSSVSATDSVHNSDDNILIEKEKKIFKIMLNRPTKFNAITLDMYKTISNALNLANSDNDTSVTVLVGNGDYYSSGNDLTNFAALNTTESISNFAKLFDHFIKSFIEHRKPLIALVNGPAFGIAVTTLGLVDFAIASDKATFQTPFTALGQSPEACSSYTFPMLMGTSKTSELLLFGKKLNAQNALNSNLIAQIISHNQFQEEAIRRVAQFSELPPQSLCFNKQLLRNIHKEQLMKAHANEIELFKQRWGSEETLQAIKNFVNRKK